MRRGGGDRKGRSYVGEKIAAMCIGHYSSQAIRLNKPYVRTAAQAVAATIPRTKTLSGSKPILSECEAKDESSQIVPVWRATPRNACVVWGGQLTRSALARRLHRS